MARKPHASTVYKEEKGSQNKKRKVTKTRLIKKRGDLSLSFWQTRSYTRREKKIILQSASLDIKPSALFFSGRKAGVNQSIAGKKNKIKSAVEEGGKKQNKNKPLKSRKFG